MGNVIWRVRSGCPALGLSNRSSPPKDLPGRRIGFPCRRAVTKERPRDSADVGRPPCRVWHHHSRTPAQLDNPQACRAPLLGFEWRPGSPDYFLGHELPPKDTRGQGRPEPQLPLFHFVQRRTNATSSSQNANPAQYLINRKPIQYDKARDAFREVHRDSERAIRSTGGTRS